MQFHRKYSFLIFLLLTTALLSSACTRSASRSSSDSFTNPNDTEVFDYFQAAANQTAQAATESQPLEEPTEEEVELPTLPPPTEVPTAKSEKPTQEPTAEQAKEEEKPVDKNEATPTAEPTKVEKKKEITPQPTSEVSVPKTYTLRKGESPFCIARRFDININAILDTNGLWLNQYYEAGLVLTLPKGADAFDGERQLLGHPETYVVQQGDTFFTIACAYGDIYPQSIAEANDMDLSDKLEPGDTIFIP